MLSVLDSIKHIKHCVTFMWNVLNLTVPDAIIISINRSLRSQSLSVFPTFRRLKARTDRSTTSAGDQQVPRILSGSPSQYYDVPSVQDLALEVPTRRPHSVNSIMVFPNDHDHNYSTPPFAFPTGSAATGGNRQGKRAKMTFPDRTGTGGLRAELDQYGNYKGVYYADGAVRFVDENDVRPSGTAVPQLQMATLQPTDQFIVGNRLTYGRRPKFQFPRTS